MTDTPEEAQAGVADALHELSESSRALVRHEIAAAQREMWEKARGAWPGAALLGGAALAGVLAVAASYRLSIRLLEKSLPPTVAALAATAVYGAAAVTAGVAGARRLRSTGPLFPVETARQSVRTVADTVAPTDGTR